MLVLTRNVNETIVIDERIEVTVVSIVGGQVRLGIRAAPDIPIRRHELQPKPRVKPRPAVDVLPQSPDAPPAPDSDTR